MPAVKPATCRLSGEPPAFGAGTPGLKLMLFVYAAVLAGLAGWQPTLADAAEAPRDPIALRLARADGREAGQLAVAETLTRIVPFETAPFPYRGTIPGTGKPFLPPYHIFTVQDVKIAVIGVTSHTVAGSLKAVKEGLEATDAVAALREYVPMLREQADLVVVLSHMGVGEDKRVAREIPGIDVIFGGHSHAWQAAPINVENRERSAFRINGTISAYCYENGGELGRLDLRLRKNNGRYEIMGFRGQLIPVTSDIPEQPKTAKVIDKYYKPIAPFYGETVGEAADTFFNDRAGENTMLNLICDAMREATGTQIAVYGEAGCRADLVKGPVKMWDISIVLPTSNKLVTMQVTGARLKEHLALRIPGVSAGLKYKVVGVIAEDGPRKGQRVGKVVECTLDGKPVDDNAIYTLTTHDWFLQLFFKDITDAKILDIDCRGAIAEHFRKHKVVSPVKDGRRNVDRSLL